MAARENEIGHCRCPVCRSDRARLRINTKGLAYVVCDACNSQVFARSDRSDTHLRAMHIKAGAPTPPTAAPPSPVADPGAVPAPAPAPAPKPRFTWGAFPS